MVSYKFLILTAFASLGMTSLAQKQCPDYKKPYREMMISSAENQLPDYKKTHKVVPFMTTSAGAPVSDKTASLTAGPMGPIVMQDNVLLEEIAHFDRERIPERVVHAKGAGAFGYFVVTRPEMSRYCKAALFSEVGKRTPIAVRFSFVTGEHGTADTIRDTRGFAVKFYTDEGIWDLVGNNTPIFFVRDPMLFPSLLHSHMRNPLTNLYDANMYWDFNTLEPQTVHQLMLLFTDRGIPDGYRHMNGYGSHTFKLVNGANHPVYCKFHFKTNQGIRNLSAHNATRIAGIDPDYATRDLFNAIAKGNCPSWTLSMQIMTYEQAERFPWNPFDLTKVWPQADFPLVEVGEIVLNRNPSNYFAEVEQIAFSPSHMPPGIEPSADRTLQLRLFSYPDTQRYRLGINSQQLPVNCPFRTRVVTNHRDGAMCLDNQDGSPNYFPNSYHGQRLDPRGGILKYRTVGDVARYNSSNEDNFSQPAIFWRQVLNDQERTVLVYNIVQHLKNAEKDLQIRAVKMFEKVDLNFGHQVRVGLQKVQRPSDYPLFRG